MAKPKESSEEVEDWLDKMAKKMYDVERTKAIRREICVDCKSEVDMSNFRDEKSKEEYRISGLCQNCQDEVF